jgi:hypothetical protein
VDAISLAPREDRGCRNAHAGTIGGDAEDL